MLMGNNLFLKTVFASVFQTSVFADMTFSAENYKIMSQGCDYTVSDFSFTSESSVATCALQCFNLGNCQMFASKGNECEYFPSCIRTCTPVTGGATGWDIYASEGRCIRLDIE